MSKGFIKLHRSLLRWEWYDDHNATRLLLHFLLTVNYKDTKWQGNIIKAGSRVIGRTKLAEETGLSEQQIRTNLNRLEKSGEITIKTTNKYSVVSLVKWDKLQVNTIEATNKITNEQPTNNQQITTSKEYKEYKEERVGSDGFIKLWNELRTKILKKPSHLNRVNAQDLMLINNYTKEDIEKALIGFFRQKAFPRGQDYTVNAKHFLNHVEIYLQAYHDQNPDVWGKQE